MALNLVCRIRKQY